METVTILAVLYQLFVVVGVLIGLPGGMRYQGDVDAYLRDHPELTRSTLPFPGTYASLSRGQAIKYMCRGIPDAIASGILMPLLIALMVLCELRVMKDESGARIMEAFWREVSD